MIYFHDDEHIVYITHNGIEKVFKIERIPAGWFSKAKNELREVSNCYYNASAFLRRFMMDPMNFNHQLSTRMSKINLLKFRADVLQRHLKLNIYRPECMQEKIENISRFYQDKNINAFSGFLVNNYRRE